jgi:hypothetical protein
MKERARGQAKGAIVPMVLIGFFYCKKSKMRIQKKKEEGDGIMV